MAERHGKGLTVLGAALGVSAALTMFGVRAEGPTPRIEGKVLTGKEAMGDWTTDVPGLRRHLTLDDLPPAWRYPLGQEPAQDGQAAGWSDAAAPPRGLK